MLLLALLVVVGGFVPPFSFAVNYYLEAAMLSFSDRLIRLRKAEFSREGCTEVQRDDLQELVEHTELMRGKHKLNRTSMTISVVYWLAVVCFALI